jgi:uracil-DNA glycosylase
MTVTAVLRLKTDDSEPMHLVHIEFTGGWDGWREAARPLLGAGVPPERVVWAETGRAGADPVLGLFSDPPAAADATGAEVRVPRRFFEIGEMVALHREAERWALLYRVLWRIARGERKLLEVEVDADVRRLIAMERAVRRASHKMKAFVRFRATGGEDNPYVAWFEPEHPVTERVAPFFARRFASMQWSILTPDGCAHWDGETLRFTPGVPRSAAPAADDLEDLWRTYYAHIFNPARLNSSAMQAEMPKTYWKNLPEAELIPRLKRDAVSRVRRMVEGQSTPATEPALRPRRTGPPREE